MAATDVTVARNVTVAQGAAYPVPAPRGSARVATRVETGRIARRAAAGGLVVAMAVGSVALWTAIPLGGLWLAAQVSGGSITQLSAPSALVALVGIPLAMALGGKGLAQLEHRYMRLTGTARKPRVPAYRRSLSESSSPPPATVLERIMVVSVLAAVVAFAAWFFLLAGSNPPV
jgi:hypothetical protein